MKNILLVSLLFFMANVNSQNLLDLSTWEIGAGGLPNFTRNGEVVENSREWGIGPFNSSAILWKASSDGGNNSSGGWNTTYIPIDHTKTYRFSVWIKKTNSNDGHTYLGCNGNVNNTILTLAGVANNNPYFWVGDLPELNKWYLIVGYIHGSGDNSTINYGGIYDGITGKKNQTITDFKFSPITTSVRHRSYLYYDTNINDRQYFYAPKIDLINGDEPTLEAMLGVRIQEGFNGDMNFMGNVGIGTTTPDSKLTVAGNIHSREVQVTVNAGADFVFDENYNLPKLEEVQEFIKENRHLPEIASAKNMEENGIQLSKMNIKLLQKIEELTLYTIEQEKQLKEQKEKNNEMEERLKKLEKLLTSK